MTKSVDYMQWNDKLSVGVKRIDDQHKHFISLMDKLFEAMQTDESDAVSKIIDELVAYADEHFATEEEYFDKFDYPGAEEHKAEHRKIKAKVNNFLTIKDDDPFTLGYELLDLLEDWLFEHIIQMDTKYVKFFKENGVH